MPIANNEPAGLGGARNLKRLAYFAAVVETGSFTAAADRLGITKAVVSQQVAKLESEFRATLLVRTTRRVRPTDVGLALYQRCGPIFQAAEAAFGELTEAAAEPSGMLRLTAPFDYGAAVVVSAVTAFTQKYSACKAEVMMSDQTLDLVAENLELAIRVGWLTNTGQQARRIGDFQQILVGAPGVVASLGSFDGPEILERAPFVANTVLRDPLDWCFSAEGAQPRTVTARASIFLDATLAVHEAVRQGAGLSVLPDYAVAADLASGRLVRALPRWTLPTGGIHVVFPAARFRSAKANAFVDLLAKHEKRRRAALAPFDLVAAREPLSSGDPALDQTRHSGTSSAPFR